MTKKNKKIILITSMITILPILAGLILWNKLPEQVATHFDFNGIPNGYSSRAFAVFGPYLICLFAHLFCAFGTLADPKKQAIGQKMYALILWICPAFPISMVLILAVTFIPMIYSFVYYLRNEK